MAKKSAGEETIIALLRNSQSCYVFREHHWAQDEVLCKIKGEMLMHSYVKVAVNSKQLAILDEISQ